MQNFDADFTILSVIESMSNQFTKTDWRIAQFIQHNTKKFVESSALDIANETKTSDASVIRFAQKIGFKGFYDMRLQLQKELENNETNKKTGIEVLQQDYLVSTQRSFTKFTDELLLNISYLLKSAKQIYICAFDQYSYLTNIFVSKFIPSNIFALPITNINDFILLSNNISKDVLFLVITTPTNVNKLEESIEQIVSRDGKIITISKMANEYPKIKHIHISVPVISDLLSYKYVSDDTLYLTLFDIINFAVNTYN